MNPNGGGSGIRTRETLTGLLDFESSAFDQLSHPSKIDCNECLNRRQKKLYSKHTMPQTKRIKHIGPMSVGKIIGLLYAILGGIFGSIFGIMMLISSAFAPSTAEKGAAFGIGLGMIIFFPIFYGVMGFAFGVLFSYLYNLLASWIGGIEIELK